MIDIHGVYMYKLNHDYARRKSFVRKNFRIVSETRKEMVLHTDDEPVTVTIRAERYWEPPQVPEAFGKNLEDAKNEPVRIEIVDSVIGNSITGYLYRASEELYLILLQ